MAIPKGEQAVAQNAEAIFAAITSAAGELMPEASQALRDYVATLALDCVADEMNHAEKQGPINKVLEQRLRELATHPEFGA